jgi:hypothetical protein
MTFVSVLKNRLNFTERFFKQNFHNNWIFKMLTVRFMCITVTNTVNFILVLPVLGYLFQFVRRTVGTDPY